LEFLFCGALTASRMFSKFAGCWLFLRRNEIPLRVGQGCTGKNKLQNTGTGKTYGSQMQLVFNIVWEA
jgi:hypothetical protein